MDYRIRTSDASAAMNSTYGTAKNSAKARRETLARRQVRAVKYAAPSTSIATTNMPRNAR